MATNAPRSLAHDVSGIEIINLDSDDDEEVPTTNKFTCVSSETLDTWLQAKSTPTAPDVGKDPGPVTAEEEVETARDEPPDRSETYLEEALPSPSDGLGRDEESSDANTDSDSDSLYEETLEHIRDHEYGEGGEYLAGLYVWLNDTMSAFLITYQTQMNAHWLKPVTSDNSYESLGLQNSYTKRSNVE